MLLKQLGRLFGQAGSWDAGLDVERRVLTDSMSIDPGAFSLQDGSGLSSGNLIAPRALVRLLSFMWRHPNRAGFLDGLPRAQQPGSLEMRFRGTPLEGRVIAKTGSINRVNALAGYVTRDRGGPLIFAVMLNDHTATQRAALDQIDSVVVEFVR